VPEFDGDFDGDNNVDVNDLVVFVDQWLYCMPITTAQQFMIGLDANEVTTFTLWPDGTDFSAGPDPNLSAVAARVANDCCTMCSLICI